jgi:peroxin-5
LPALLAIATSLTNEHRNDEALEALEKWLRAHPRYRDMGSASPEGAAEDDTYDIYVMQPQLHHRVRAMFAEAAATLPGMADADVHMALGVIHHMVHQFDHAVKAFQSALQLRPEDARLWNKLGATLANSRRSEDALVAYSRALDLSPGFARAQYNVGIAYSNLVMYPEAARAFLQALHMQQSSLPGSSAGLTNSVSSAAIWEVLRSTFAMMQRPDLIEKAELGAITAFEDEFHFL